MDNSGITPVMPIGGGYGDGFGGGGFWIFALLVLAMMGGGFGWGGNNFANAIGYENLATSNEVQRGFDAQNSLANEREILSAVNQSFHDTLSVQQSLYNETARDIAALAVQQQQIIANQNECCCNTRLMISESTAATNANLTAQIQSVKDMLSADKIESLQNQINALQLQNAVAGVVRYPNSLTYTAGASPFCSCGI